MNDDQRQRLIVAQVAVKAAVDICGDTAAMTDLADTTRAVYDLVFDIADLTPGTVRSVALEQLRLLVDLLDEPGEPGWEEWKAAHQAPLWSTDVDLIREASRHVASILAAGPQSGDEPPSGSAVAPPLPDPDGDPKAAG